MFHTILKLTDKYRLVLFCTVVLVFILPPVYLFPIRNPLLTSHSLARYVLFALFFYTIYICYARKVSIPINKLYGNLVVFYFFSVSISIVNADNVGAFLQLYKHLVVSIMVFFVTSVIVRKKDIEYVINTLVLSVILNVIFEFFFYFAIKKEIFALIIYDNAWNVIEKNALRNKYFIEIYNSALVPLILYKIKVDVKSFRTYLYMILLTCILFLSYVSNFRTHLAMFSLALFSTFLVLPIQKSRKIVLFFASIVVVSAILISSQILTSTISVIPRSVQYDPLDTSSMTRRYEMWQDAYDMGNAYPLFGVGLRNYYDNIASKPKYLGYSDWQQDLQTITLAHPHNVFFGTLAETGYLGLFSYILLIGYFAYSDIKKYKNGYLQWRVLLVSFWVLFSFSLMNPPDTLPYLCLFWLIRGLMLVGQREQERS